MKVYFYHNDLEMKKVIYVVPVIIQVFFLDKWLTKLGLVT